MCIEISNNNMNSAIEYNVTKHNKKVISYSVKKLLRQLFKQQKSPQVAYNSAAQPLEHTKHTAANSLLSLESLENTRNADIESVAECASLESFENEANERLSCEMEDFDIADIINTVPVHFVRTTHGTFFWTATTNIAADNDLIEPLYCSTSNQIACTQFHDRWAQA